MTYQPFLVAKFATGLDKELQPWLIPEDAYAELFDGFTLHGVLRKRNGYNGLATGQRSDTTYCESRMVGGFTDLSMTGTIDGANTTFTTTAPETPIQRGSFTISSSTPAQTATDDGVGGFTGDVSAGTIDYNTGAISVTFNTAPTAGTVTYSYQYHPEEPVMGLMNFQTATDVKQLYIASTSRVNFYNTTTNRLEYVGRTGAITGATTASPSQITSTAHGMQTGDTAYIYGVVGTNDSELNGQTFTITRVDANNFTIGSAYTGTYSSGGTWQQRYTGNKFNFWDWVNYPSNSGNPRLIFTNNQDEIQVYDPSLTPSFIDYVSSPDFTFSGITSLKCLHLKYHKDRLLLFRTTENGVVYPKRIRISGLGANGDTFDSTAIGAGFIDIPTGGWITDLDFNRDDIIIFTDSGFTQETWILRYTNNDVVPFVLDKIDESRGGQAPYGTITYLNRTSGVATRSLIMTDGYRVERMDDKIPDYSYQEIDAENFDLSFASQIDDNHQHILIHPSPQQSESDRMLVTNYDEDSFSVYRIPLSCAGVYQQGFDVTWDDLLIYSNWDEFAAAYSNWNSFAYSANSPFTVGGGHKGEVWRLNVNEGEDNPQRIRSITITDAESLTVTTDWNNYKVGDYIYFAGLSGMVQLNKKQAQIQSVTDNYTFVVRIRTAGFSAYTSGGTANRVIPFEMTTKKFNPYVNSGKKVKCGWVYFYVTTTDSSVERDFAIDNITQANPAVVTTEDAHNLSNGQSVRIYNVAGMTEVNNLIFEVTVLSPTSFSLNGIDSTGYTAYSSGGFVAINQKCELSIDVITNDTEEPTQLQPAYGQEPYQGNCTNLVTEQGVKKWYKLWINQSARFVQFRIKNAQAGTNIEIHAIMPGFAPIGRLI